MAADFAGSGAVALLPASPGWVNDIAEKSAQPISLCYLCQKCTSGCPLAFALDILPHRLIHYVQLGQKDVVLRSRAIWLCAACRACAARCPNGIDVAAVADVLKLEATRYMHDAGSEHQVRAFHQVFLSSLQQHGRLHELGMLLRYSLRRGAVTRDLGLGLALLRRGRLKLCPGGVRSKEQIHALFARAREGRNADTALL